MDVFTAIHTRASAIKLRAPAPTRAELESIIDAGARAPDHGKFAPWRFVVLGEMARQQLGEAMAQHLAARDAQADADQLQRERNKAQRAPCIIAVIAHVTASPKVPDLEQVVATGAAIQNMFLAAHALGYGLMWKTGPAAYNTDIKTLLGAEPQDHIVGLLYIGTPDIAGTPRGAVLKAPVRWLD